MIKHKEDENMLLKKDREWQHCMKHSTWYLSKNQEVVENGYFETDIQLKFA
jgi:hypothetical protein